MIEKDKNIGGNATEPGWKFYLLMAFMFFGITAIGANYTRFTDVIVKNAMSIGSNAAPNSKSVLDLTSTTLGFLPPRMTEVQRDAISSPPAGLVIFNTTSSKLNQYSGTAWSEVGSGSGGGGSDNINILADYNPKAELGATTNYTSSGGTFTVTSTAANVAAGDFSFSYDAAANADYVLTSQVTIPAGLFGQNCLAQFYYKGFDSNITAQVYDGTNVLGALTLSAATNYTPVQINTVCPSSGTLAIRLLATGNAAIGYFDEMYLGSALNFTNISMAQAAGSSYIATTTNCLASVTSTTIAQFGTDADCPGPTIENAWIGSWQTTDADLPRQTINNLPPGRYKLEVTGGFNGGTGGRVAIALTDGTTTSSSCPVYGNNANIGNGSCVAWFEYSSAGNRTFEVRGSASSGTVQWINDTNNMTLHFVLTRYPLSYEQAYKPSQVPFFWEGRHDGTCAWTRGNTAYGDPTGDASCTLADFVNVNAGTVTSTSNGALTLTPGISLVFPRTSRYEVCGEFRSGGDTVGATNAFQMVCGGVTIAQRSNNEPSSGGLPLDLCGIYSPTTVSGTPTDCKIQMAASSGTGAIQANSSYHYTIRWTVEDIISRSQSPQIVNSMVSSYSGVSSNEAAKINCDSGSAITSQHGSWVSSVGNISGGACAVTLSSGIFSSTPYCVAVPATSGGFSTGLELNVDATSSTAVSVDCEDDASNACTTFDFILHCMGAK